MRARLSILLLAGASLLSIPAFAQSSDGDVVMRRPLLNAKNGQGTPTPTPGTPTPTPGSPTPTPGSPTPTPGTSVDPTVEPYNPPTDPGSCQGVLEWSYGAWQGSATCGQQSTLTRTIGCQCVQQGGLSVGAITPRDVGGPDIRNASFVPGADRLAMFSDGVYDPHSSDVRALLAQFSTDPGTGDGFKVTDMPMSYCMQELGSPPVNSYKGTKAGCGYHNGSDMDYSGWMLDPGYPGTVTCSASAYRLGTPVCLDQDDNQVDQGYCTNDIEEGGRQTYPDQYADYGNFSGCTAKWVRQGSDIGCSPDPNNTDPAQTTPTHYAYYQAVCMRSDGTVLTGVGEASCSADDRPFDGPVVIGACYKDPDYWFEDFAPGALQGMCASQIVFCGGGNPNDADAVKYGCEGAPDPNDPNYPHAYKVGDKQNPDDPSAWAMWNATIDLNTGKVVPNGGSMFVCYNPYKPYNHPAIPDQ